MGFAGFLLEESIKMEFIHSLLLDSFIKIGFFHPNWILSSKLDSSIKIGFYHSKSISNDSNIILKRVSKKQIENVIKCERRENK